MNSHIDGKEFQGRFSKKRDVTKTDHLIEAKNDQSPVVQSLVFEENIDKQTMFELKHAAQIINNSENQHHTRTGKVLKEINEMLAKNGYGIWGQFCVQINVHPKTAERLINRYNFIKAHKDKKDFIENLFLSLTYEISAPSAPEELINKVLEGEITTKAEFVRRKKELKVSKDSGNKKITFDGFSEDWSSKVSEMGHYNFDSFSKFEEEDKKNINKLLKQFNKIYEEIHKITSKY